jgi:hypothetical protein
MPKNHFLGCIEFRKSISAQRTFHRATPVLSTLKIVVSLVPLTRETDSAGKFLHYIQDESCEYPTPTRTACFELVTLLAVRHRVDQQIFHERQAKPAIASAASREQRADACRR